MDRGADPRGRDGVAHVFLHGFASGARSTKGTHLRRAFARRGVDLILPDLNVPSFETMTYTSMLDALDRLDADRRPARWNVLGSSLGGYLAARWAERRPDRVGRLVLLCPGFDLASRWPTLLGAEALETWRRRGWHEIPDGTGTPRRLRWDFLDDAEAHPAYPRAVAPTLVIHGTRDDVVPPATSRSWAVRNPDLVTRVEVDDDHRLLRSIDRIEREAAGFLGLPAPS